MELTERITGRASVLAGEIELLRKQLADAEHELERLTIAEQVITRRIADDARGAGPAQRGCWCHRRSKAADPGDYRSLLKAVPATAGETGGSVTCAHAPRPPAGRRQ
jgi:hypothetical protein